MGFRPRNAALGIAASISIIGSMIVTGCGRTSPYVGVWSGQAKVSPNTSGLMALPLAMMGNVTGKLTLGADGKGFLKMSIAPEQPIAWSEQDGSLILHRSGGDSSSGKNSSTSSGDLVGHLSQDKQTLTIDLGPMSMELHPDKGDKS